MSTYLPAGVIWPSISEASDKYCGRFLIYFGGRYLLTHRRNCHYTKIQKHSCYLVYTIFRCGSQLLKAAKYNGNTKTYFQNLIFSINRIGPSVRIALNLGMLELSYRFSTWHGYSWNSKLLIIKRSNSIIVTRMSVRTGK